MLHDGSTNPITPIYSIPDGNGNIYLFNDFFTGRFTPDDSDRLRKFTDGKLQDSDLAPKEHVWAAYLRKLC
jgi:hypothetical protein